MKYWVTKDHTRWGQCADKSAQFLDQDCLVYDSEVERLKANPELEKLESNKELQTQLSSHDFVALDAVHGIKAMEAMSYKFLKAPKEACVFCLAYSITEGVPFEDAIDAIWEKHIKSAEAEADRTSAKSKIRKNRKHKND